MAFDSPPTPRSSAGAATAPTVAIRGRRDRAIVAAIAVATTVLVYWLTTARSWDPTVRPMFGASEFFGAQTEAMLRGRLHVEPADLAGECYVVDDRCYGYYGVTPSVLRLPVVPIMRRTGSGLTPLFLTGAIMVSIATASRLAVAISRLFRPTADWRWPAFAALVILGPAGSMLVITRPFVYDEAVAWSVAFTLLTFLIVVEWHRERAPLWWAVPTAIAAANARPTAISTMAMLGAGIVFVALRAARPVRWRVVVAGLAIATLPAATAFGVFLLKFGQPVPDLMLNEQVPEAPAWEAVLAANGNRTMGVQFAPTTLVAFFRPDSLRLHGDAPWVEFAQPGGPTVLPPLPDGGAYTTRLGSATNLMPIPVAATVVASVWLVRRRRPATRRSDEGEDEDEDGDRPIGVVALLLLAGVAATALPVTNVAITQRNVLDFYPLLTVGCCVAIAVSATPLATTIATPSRRRLAIAIGAGTLTIWSALANVAIAWQFVPGL